MAEQSFLQIPTTVWWGIRQLLQRTPKAKLDESMLSASLGVQPTAARQYLTELKRVGLFDEDGRSTELANRWRMDETYWAAVEDIASSSYPESLVTIAPPGAADRKRVVNWFMTQGLGEGSAKNKAATYLLITSLQPNAAPNGAAKADPLRSGEKDIVAKPTKNSPTKTKPLRATMAGAGGTENRTDEGIIPLNLNIQIHISADASNDQIETIFSAMRKYLRND